MVPGASSGPSPQPAASWQFCDAWGEENELAADRGAARGVLLALGTPALLWGAPKQPPKQPAAPAERCQPPPEPPRLRTGSHPAQHLLPSRTQPPPQRLPPAPHATRACKQPRAAAGGRGQSRAAAVQLQEGLRGTSRADSCGDSCGDGAGRLSRNRAGEARQEASALPRGRLLPCCPNPAVQVDYRHWRWLTARGGSSKTCPISPG